MDKPHCWCDQPELTPFNEDYLRCLNCRTLIGRSRPESAAAFYGRHYWTTRQTDTLGHPDIHQRARLDLSDRAIYWLKTLLAYKRPPGTTLELGSGHGGFSALLQWAGFEAVGLEPHAWVSQLARTIFNIPTLTGRLADQSLEPQSLDAVILLDVLEHLPDPAETLHQCRQLLKADGLLLIQTPAAPPQAAMEELEAAENPFLKMLLPLEHLYLYSKEGLQQLLHQSGFQYLNFEPALFPYDMFLVAAVSPLPKPVEADPAESLLSSPSGRLVLALIDLHRKWQTAEANEQKQRQQRHQLEAHLREVEADRTARLEQIRELNERLQTAEADRSARLAQIQTLAASLAQSEADRAARKTQIETLSEQLQTAEADREARLAQVQELTALLKESEADRAARKAQIETISGQLETAEGDRQARLEQIQTLSRQLQEAETDRTDRLEQIERLTGWLQTAEADSKARLEQVNELTALLRESEADRADRLEQVNELTRLLEESEDDRAARLEQIHTLTATIQSLQHPTDDSKPPAPDN
jgi:2-polyprenyl-3-methyl-5-hydroxy-6-metoxy-1,4-benzoquinol methylase